MKDEDKCCHSDVVDCSGGGGGGDECLVIKSSRFRKARLYTYKKNIYMKVFRGGFFLVCVKCKNPEKYRLPAMIKAESDRQ